MSQPKALFLADVMHNDPCSKAHHDEAAFELRRLHAENEELRAANAAFGKRQEWWNERMVALEAQRDALLDEIQTHSAAVYECTRLLAEAREQRDALLEACKTLVNLPETEDWIATLRLAVEQARAAIKAVEGEGA